MSQIDIEFYSIKEVAVIFNVHPNTIRNAIKNGYINAIRIGDKKKSPYRISRKSIDQIHINVLKEKSIKICLKEIK